MQPTTTTPPTSRRRQPSGTGFSSQERDFARLLFVIVGICCFVLVVRESFYSSSSSRQQGMSTISSTIPDDNVDADYLIQYVRIEGQRKVDDMEMIRYAAYRKGVPVSVLEWAQLLAQSPDRARLAQDFTKLIQQLTYDAVYLETKGASATTAPTKQWEVVFLAAPRLQAFAESNPDPNAFAEHFTACQSDTSSSTSPSVCSFSNLSGDAYLISPIPLTPNDSSSSSTALQLKHYSHLAMFVRHAPEHQVTELWTTVAKEYYQRLLPPTTTSSSSAASSNVVWWLNTEGTGVAWLHIRLDKRPKYYHYTPFAQET